MKDIIKDFVYTVLLALRDVLDPVVAFREVSIFAYHSISDAPLDTAVSADALDAQLKMLRGAGYEFVSLDRLLGWVEGKNMLPKKAIAVTFDDGYADFETIALPILECYTVPAALFVVGEEKASRPGMQNDIPLLDIGAIERLRAHKLVTIGYHSKTHPDLTNLSDSALAADVAPPFSVAYFAYPGGKHNKRVRGAVRAAGYRAAFTIRPDLVSSEANPYGLPRSVITHDMDPVAVRLRATKAIHWYRALSRLFI